MKGIYLLLGSNLGDRFTLLKKARLHIAEQIGPILKESAIYATKAWGIADQPDFLNQVLEIESDLPAEQILEQANMIEEKLGRIRRIKWHSRIIDIDILYYSDLVLNTKNLTIPHPENENRKFVLVPMVELCPEFVHPKLMMTHDELLKRCPDTLDVVKTNIKKSQLHQ